MPDGIPLSRFNQAYSGPGRIGLWKEPSFILDLGGNLAVWCEPSDPASPHRSATPWMVLHGGPGGRLSAAHVAPLRQLGLPWFGFDQRNSGLSEDIDFSAIDTQRFIDDALQLADHLCIDRFHILGGSWGATLALALAAHAPQRVAGLVLRAPFIPWVPRVDAFIGELEQQDPALFKRAFRPGARGRSVFESVLSGSTAEQVLAVRVWNALEMGLLQWARPSTAIHLPDLTPDQQDALLRKYRLQAHFLMHGCFISTEQWVRDVEICATAAWPVAIIQGQKDRICPPGGAIFLSEMLPNSTLHLHADLGHLPDSSTMVQAVSQAVFQLLDV
ncbi:alpha/beta hydrolase [Limnobacter humi]|uniref:Proline iminopeptidase n=1 Tax=Limnobacter humi TaxID=1778671 RepID=A0ABT1WF04_9BURK|nr:alpha/beta fold hydrolase [Limnobacter humi]MCQ8896103.1 alpha/beta hydrolase [Limnobacter humi]